MVKPFAAAVFAKAMNLYPVFVLLGGNFGLAPFGGEVERERERHADDPADRPGEPDARGGKRGLRQRERQHDAQDQVGERGDHKAPHHARATENAVGDELCRDEEIERRDDAQKLHTDIHRLAGGAVEEDIDQPAARAEIERDNRHAERENQHESGTEARLDAVILPCAEVLRREAGHAVAERGERGGDHVVQLDGCGIARHDRRTEAVDDALDHDVADRDEALLQNARDGDDRDLAEQLP